MSSSRIADNSPPQKQPKVTVPWSGFGSQTVAAEPRGLVGKMAIPANTITCPASQDAARPWTCVSQTQTRSWLPKYHRITPLVAQAGTAFRSLIWTSNRSLHLAATRCVPLVALTPLAATAKRREASACDDRNTRSRLP